MRGFSGNVTVGAFVCGIMPI